MKYIVIKNHEYDIERPIIFDSTIKHSTMFSLFASAILVSAGFVVYESCLIADFKIYCHGSSVSLRSVSRPEEDLQLIKRELSI